MTKRKININNFKFFRMKKGMTQDELAEKAGVTPRSIQYYETGRTYPSVLIAKKISDALDKTIDEIFFTQ